MNYDYTNVKKSFITCSRGAKIMISGIRDPNAFNDSILICPVHQDVIKIPAGLPKRRWEFVSVISVGQPSSIFGQQFARQTQKTPKPYTMPGNLPKKIWETQGGK